MLPLEGVKVVEFCQVLAGPYCGMLLADMGADVVKIEPPDGDMMRQWPPISDGYSENFASINRNKRSVVLDLKNPEHKAAARRLVLESDVVLENNRPGVMDRLDPFIEPRVFRRLVHKDESGQWAAHEKAIADFPKYDAIRLAELIGVVAKLLARRRKLRKIGLLGDFAPEPAGNVWDAEVLVQALIQHLKCRLEIGRGNQRERGSMQFLADPVVLGAEFQQLAEPPFELTVLLAQRDDLTLGNRNRMSAVRVRNENLRNDIRKLFEELRIVLQVMCYVVCVHLLPCPPS